MLARAERLHSQLFRPLPSAGCGLRWEPPVDILESDSEVLVLVALPGVSPDHVEAMIEDEDLLVTGTRMLPPALRTARIHRLELPQGRFERRVRLPAGRYRRVRQSILDGCLVISLDKAEASHG